MKHLLGLLAALGVLAYVAFSEDGSLSAVLGAQNGVQVGVPASNNRTPGASPDDLVAFNSDVWGTRGAVAVAVGPSHVWIEEVLSGYARPGQASTFERGTVIADATGCEVTMYDGMSPVVTVLARNSGHDLGISFQTTNMLTRGAQDLIESYKRSGYRGGLPGPGRTLEIVDVVVPAAPEPAHLALLSTRDALVWSFHFEEGATLAGVTLIGGQAGGVLNLPDGVPVEAISARALDDCDQTVMVQDYFNVSQAGQMAAVVTDGTPAPAPRVERPTTLAELEQAVAEARPSTFRLWKTSFELWFSRQFSQNPRTAIAGYADVQVVVAGDPPAAPVAWSAPSGGTLRLVNGPIYIIGNARERSAAWKDLIVLTAEQTIGAPLESIHPDNQPDPEEQPASQ